MTKKKLMATLATVLTLSLCGGLFAGCGSREAATASDIATVAQTEETGGVISLKVNPELAVHYDEKGMVTKIEARNDDGEKIITDYTGFEGKECRMVIGELVAKINEAGYFVEETDGTANQITLEIEKGSVLPGENFLNTIVAEIQKYTSQQKISTPVAINGESAYGWSNYGDTDYGPDNDGVTDYGDTDYGTTGDGVTDYVAPNTPSAPAQSSGSTDYGDTDYGSGSDGVTNYDDDGDSGYAYTQPAPPAATQPPVSQPAAPSAPVQSGDSGYDDGDSGYDSGDSGYDDGDSGYDD